MNATDNHTLYSSTAVYVDDQAKLFPNVVPVLSRTCAAINSHSGEDSHPIEQDDPCQGMFSHQLNGYTYCLFVFRVQ